MPVRLSSTAVLVWPEARVVDQAARRWAEDLTRAEWEKLPVRPRDVVWVKGSPP